MNFSNFNYSPAELKEKTRNLFANFDKNLPKIGENSNRFKKCAMCVPPLVCEPYMEWPDSLAFQFEFSNSCFFLLRICNFFFLLDIQIIFQVQVFKVFLKGV